MKSPADRRRKLERSGDTRPMVISDQMHIQQYDRTIDLDKVNEDVVTVPPVKASKVHKSHLTSGAQSVLMTNKQEEIRDVKNPSQVAPKLYVENCLGFRKQPIQNLGIGIDSENRQSMKKSLKANKDLLSTNPGIKYVVSIHQIFSLICNTLFGLLAGASLAHTLFLQLVTGPKYLPTTNDVGFGAVIRYSENARPIAITYFVVLVVTGVYILDKFDFSSPSTSCMRSCIKFQNGVLAVPFFIASFGISNAMVWLDFQIHQLSYSQYLVTPQNLEDSITPIWKIWCILDASRTAFILATWILLSFCEDGYDRLIRNLCRNLDQSIDENRD